MKSEKEAEDERNILNMTQVDNYKSPWKDKDATTVNDMVNDMFVNVSMKELSNIIKEFEKIGKLTYVKRIPKIEPTSRYYHLVRCIVECMLRSDEYNQHLHGGYAEETDPSLNVNETDEE